MVRLEASNEEPNNCMNHARAELNELGILDGYAER